MPASPTGSVDRIAPLPPGLQPGVARRRTAVDPGSFSAILERHMSSARAEVARVREQIDAIRSGGALAASASRSPATPPSPDVAAAPAPTPGAGAELPATTGPAWDPYSWRSLTRTIGDDVVGSGFGGLFERQIQQESGFAPDVVLGRRRSSAGAEGIAQLMPQYYPHVDRTDPREALIAGARTMRHYLQAWDGDVRKALASYNAGLGRVRSAVLAHGEGWERGLPDETRRYLSEIVGPARPVFEIDAAGEVAVFGGRGPGGVLTSPLAHVVGERSAGELVELIAPAGEAVRSPSDGLVVEAGGSGSLRSVVIDHGNGWRTVLQGVAEVSASPGEVVRRSEAIGAVAPGIGGWGLLRLGVTLDGRPLDPRRYMIGGAP